MVAEMLEKQYFYYVRILSFKENIFVLNQNKFLISIRGFFV